MSVCRPKRFLILLLVIVLLNSCASKNENLEITLFPTSTTAALPTPTDILPPQPTFDDDVQPYLVNVEEVLRHSAVVIKDRAVGIPDICPSMYLMAFPYSEPDRRGGMTLQVTALERDADGIVIMGEHKKLWNLKAEGVEPERCKQIYVQNISFSEMIRISFQVQHPEDESWRIGVASGTCSEKDLWLSGYFYLNNPDDFQLLITQYDQDSPLDYWLRDGDRLNLYHWEPWQETLLWTLEDLPGEILEVVWNSKSDDHTGDGNPDLLITWKTSSGTRTTVYFSSGTGFMLAEENTE